MSYTDEQIQKAANKVMRDLKRQRREESDPYKRLDYQAIKLNINARLRLAWIERCLKTGKKF